MNRFPLLVVIVACLVSGVFPQMTATTSDGRKVRLNPDKTWEFIEDEIGAKHKLSVQAALVFRSGDVVPVSRTTFLLLNRNLEEVLMSKEFRNLLKLEQSQTIAGVDSTQSFAGMLLALRYGSLYPRYTADAARAIGALRVAEGVTDFQGNLTFEDVPGGTYYLFGYTEIRRNFVAWHQQIILDRDKSLILDSNNLVN